MTNHRTIGVVMLLAFSLGLPLAIAIQLPFPELQSQQIYDGHPVLSWELGETNLLPNGSFESGTNGWEIAGFRLTNGPVRFGTNYLLGRGSVRTFVSLPEQARNIPLSFSAIDASGVTVSVQVFGAESADILPSLTIRSLSRHRFDLSRYAGTQIALSIELASVLGKEVRLDDVRIEPFPSEVNFDVYFGHSGQLTFYQRTDRFFVQGPHLDPGIPITDPRSYNWQVYRINNTNTAIGPFWRFKTEPGVPNIQVDRIDLGYFPSSVCVGQSIEVVATPTDKWGFPRKATMNLQPIVAARDAVSPSVVITELDSGRTDALEFMNVSTKRVSLAGWKVFARTFDPFTSIVEVVLPSTALLDPGAVFTLRENQTNPAWPALRLPQISWRDASARLKAEVQLVDQTGETIDLVRINSDHLSAFPLNPGLDWHSAPATYINAAQSCARVGANDNNSSSDWVTQTPSIGVTNQNLQFPFSPGFGSLNWQLPVWTNTGHLHQTNSLILESGHSNVMLFVTAAGLTVPSSIGQPLNVLAPFRCLSLLGPGSFKEFPGRIPLKLQLATPPAEPLVVRIGSSNPHRLSTEATLLIPPGASEADFWLNVNDDIYLQGDQIINIEAQADGYASGLLKILVQDDESAIITISGSDSLMEGTPRYFYFTIDPPPVNDLPLHFTFQGPAQFTNYTYLWPAYRKQTSFVVGHEEPYASFPSNVRCVISHGNWTAATWEFFYKDNDPPALKLEALGRAREGLSLDIRATLGGRSPTNINFKIDTSHPSLLDFPASLAFNTTETSTVFTVTCRENDAHTGTNLLDLRMSAPAWEAATLNLSIPDNDPVRLVLTANPQLSMDQINYISVQLLAVDGGPIEMKDPPMLKLISGSGDPIFSALVNTWELASSWVFLMNVYEPSSNIFIHASASGFNEVIGPLTSLRIGAGGLKDGVYDQVRDRFILLMTNSALTTYKPAESLLKPFLPEIEARQIAISANSTALFGLNPDGSKVFKLNFSDGKLTEWPFASFGEPPLEGHSFALAQHSPDMYAVLQSHPNNSGYSIGLYSDGKELSRVSTDLNQDGQLAFTPSGSALFAHSSDQLHYYFIHSSGELEGSLFGMGGGSSSSPFLNNTGLTDHLAFLKSGRVLDTEVHGYLTTYYVDSCCASERPASYNPLLNRFASLVVNGFSSKILVYDPITFRQLDSVPIIRHVFDYNTKLFPSGKRGWALISGGQLHLIPSPPPRAPSDLRVIGKAASPSSKVVRFTFAVTNMAQTVASNVIVGVALPSGALLLNHPTNLWMPNARLEHGYTLGNLAPGGSQEIQIDVTSLYDSKLTGAAYASAMGEDTNPLDNRASASSIISHSSPPPLTLLSMTPSRASQANIIVQTEPGWMYELLWKSDLHASFPDWSPADSNRASGVSLTFPIPIDNNPKFYRVRVHP